MSGVGTGQIIQNSLLLTDIKALLRISETDTSKDNILNIFIRRANTLILKYLNDSSLIDASVYPDAIIEYVIVCYRKMGNEGLKSASQGNRSQVYEDGLPSSVKDLLPLPYIGLM